MWGMGVGVVSRGESVNEIIRHVFDVCTLSW